MELRKDYILDRYVIISSERSKRPFDFKKESPKVKSQKDCFFCLGKESMTTEEIGRIEKKGKWNIRWFRNKYPAVEPKGNYNLKTDNHFYTFSDAYGIHEIIVETPKHKKQLSDLKEDEIAEILEVYSSRIKELSSVAGIKYVCVFKNQGLDAGTSLVHSHTQIIAYNKIPQLILEELNAAKKHSSCPYCRIIENEKNSYRRCFENSSFAAFAPYASRFHFEIWIFPKEHVRSITEMNRQKLKDLAEILKKILIKLKKLNASYNMQLHYAPKGEDLHFHIEICPRISIFGGFEILTGDTINSLPPEEAAKFYRGEKI